MRAGVRKTKVEWETLFPGCFASLEGGGLEWFIDLSKQKDPSGLKPVEIIVNKVFAQLGLRSISYKEAAAICVQEYVAINSTPSESVLMLLYKESKKGIYGPMTVDCQEKAYLRRKDCQRAIDLIMELLEKK